MAAATATATALRCGGEKAFLCGEGRVVGDGALEGCRGPLPYLRRSGLDVGKGRWGVRAVLAAPLTPAQRNAENIAASRSLHVDSFARSVSIGSGRPRREERREEKDEGRGRHVTDGGLIGREPVPPEKLDEWMRDSVVEIVRKIGDAPLLVHVFSNPSDGPASLTLEMEPADPGSWPHIRRRWLTGGALTPDGVILVEELKGVGERDAEDEDEPCSRSSSPAEGESSKTWGVLVQGRGAADCAACYILNTCRVQSSFGFCTHFCLARAKCFGDPADVQLRNAWLLGKKLRRHQQQ